MDHRFSPGGGGAETFLSFLANELLPFVDRTYRTRPYRLLIGHSFGGLFAIYALTTKPALFQGYIVADPSIYWNNDALIRQAQAFFANTRSLPADFYLTASSDAGRIPADSGRLVAVLKQAAPADFRWSFEWMKEEDHPSLPLPSIDKGLEAIFADWRLTDRLALFDKGGIEAIHRHFREAGARFGYPERTTPPFTVSLLVADLISAGRPGGGIASAAS